jgi:hypothetical protein
MRILDIFRKKPKPIQPLEWKHPKGDDGKYRKLTPQERAAQRDVLCRERLLEESKMPQEAKC